MYENILTKARQTVWLMSREKLDDVFDFFDRAAAGIRIDSQALEVLTKSNRDRRQPVTRSAVGVIPIIGTISQRASLLDESSGGASAEQIGHDFDTLRGMEEVGSIVFDIDSSGGTYPGIPELAAKIAGARGDKPIIAQVNSEAGSGALWIASAADEIVITPSGSAGSVGAYMYHDDTSAMTEKLGVKRTYFAYPPDGYKVEGNSYEPVSDDTAEWARGEVARIGQEFEAALAKYRGVPVGKVRSDWGRGRMLDAKTALQVGMVDKIATFDETVNRFATGRGKVKSRPRVEAAKRLLQINAR